MKKIKIKTPAKINLTLEVLNKRPDGFHNIQSVMQAINLYDYLTFELEEKAGIKINLSGNSDEIPYDERNLIYKCALKFFEKAGIKNAHLNVSVEKNIPVSAGLAGGSTNGAGTFYALNKLYNNLFSINEVDELCAKMGSDLNFCLKGGCMLCTSRGEVTENLPFLEQNVSLIKPKNLGISAKEAYTQFSRLTDKTNPNNTYKLKQLLEQGKFDKSLIYNSLEKALFCDYKELQEIKNKLPNSLMSGSGSTFFVLEPSINADFDKNNYQIFENLKTVPEGVLTV